MVVEDYPMHGLIYYPVFVAAIWFQVSGVIKPPNLNTGSAVAVTWNNYRLKIIGSYSMIFITSVPIFSGLRSIGVKDGIDNVAR